MKKETLMRFKRATAAGLVSAILALGTSCGYKPEHTTGSTQPSQTTQTSETTQTTQTTGVPYVEVDPKVDTTVIGKENTLSLINLSNTVRQMINDDSAFGNNFSYRAESVLVTGISVTDYVEEAASEDVQQDETPKKSLVTISYTADAVDKTTGEKANISDSISYVTQNQEVNKLSNKAFTLSDVDAFSTALIEANQEKIAEAQKSQPTTPSGDTTIKTDPADAIKSSTTVADQNQQNDIVQYVIDNYLKEALQNAIDSSQYVQELIDLGYNIEKVYFVGNSTDFRSEFRRMAYSGRPFSVYKHAADNYYYQLKTPYFYMYFDHTAHCGYTPGYEQEHNYFLYTAVTGSISSWAIALARNSETNDLIAIEIPAGTSIIIADDVKINLLAQLGIKDNVDYLNIHKFYDTPQELIYANIDFEKIITQNKTKEELAENAMLIINAFANNAEKRLSPLYNLAIDYCNIYDITNHPRKRNNLDIGILRYLTNQNQYSLDFTQPQQEKK